MAVSRDMMHLLCIIVSSVKRQGPVYQDAYLVNRNLEKHIPGPLHAKEFARDRDEVLLGQQSRVALTEHARKRRGKVYIRGSLFLNVLDDTALPTRDDVVQLVIDLANFRV